MRNSELGYTVADQKDEFSCASCSGIVAYTGFICCDKCWLEKYKVNRITGINRNLDGGDSRRMVIEQNMIRLPFSEFQNNVSLRIYQLQQEIPLKENFCIHQAMDDARLDMNMVDVAAYAYMIEREEQEKNK